MCMWAEMIMDVPGYIGHQTRGALARLNDAAGSPLPAEFFHYEGAGPIPDKPPLIRMHGNGRNIRIVGVTDDGAILMYRHAAAVAHLVDGVTRRWSFREGQFSAEPSYERKQTVRSLAVSLSPISRNAAMAGDFSDPSLIGEVTKLLRDSMERQMFWWLPDEQVPEIGDVVISKSVPVRLSQKGGAYLSALDVSFKANKEFNGPWQLGRLQARGYGRLCTQMGGH